MIDLDALEREANSEESETVTIERSLLALVHAEVSAGRAAREALARLQQELLAGQVAKVELDILNSAKRGPTACTAEASAQ